MFKLPERSVPDSQRSHTVQTQIFCNDITSFVFSYTTPKAAEERFLFVDPEGLWMIDPWGLKAVLRTISLDVPTFLARLSLLSTKIVPMKGTQKCVPGNRRSTLLSLDLIYI